MSRYLIKKVSSDYENLKYNTAIAALMSILNDFSKAGKINRAEFKTFLLLLNPVAPHITEELWNRLGHSKTISFEVWPTFDEAKIQENTVELPIQFNGKLRATIKIAKDLPKEEVEKSVKANERVKSLLEGKNIVKEIYVPNKIYNIVVK